MIKSNGRTRNIPRNKTIKVWLKDSDELLKGKYEVLSDTSIAVNKRIVMLSDIEKISGFNWISLFSPVLVGGGASGVGFGAVATFYGALFTLVGYGPLLLIGGVTLIAVSAIGLGVGIYIWHHSKSFKLGKKWQIAVEHQAVSAAVPNAVGVQKIY